MWAIALGAVVGLVGALRLLYPPLWRDLVTAWVSIKIVLTAKKALRTRELCVDRLERQARKIPHKCFLKFKDQTFSYSEADARATRCAQALRAHGLEAGATVALVAPNSPDFLWLFFGAQKLGARCALVNVHLQDDSLLHSITVCEPRMVVVGNGDDLPARVAAISPRLPSHLPILTLGPAPPLDRPSATPSCSLTNLYDVISDRDPVQLGPVDPVVRKSVSLNDPFAFIYTSGTTGLPKAAIITHKKVVLCSHVYGCLGLRHDDVMYCPLPLYHASALCLATLNVINVGATLVLREKFSSTGFWADCARHGATAVQYIGEMLRYLVNSPETAIEKEHSLRLCVGNGLRADVWARFSKRFNVPHMYEFYGSTEGPAHLTNMFNVEGSVGRLSPLLQRVMKLSLVRVDPDTKQPHRTAEGRCVPIHPGESGLMLSQLNARQTFEGYVGPPQHTKARILQDVFEPGDFWVNSGDMFRLDAEYNVYFVDRVGDSFRWKGENVSTAEVSNVMNSADFVEDTNVFGIEVPGMEGKAGMAAVSLRSSDVITDAELQEIGTLCKRLPQYARPRFLRIQRQMSLTSTFKQVKVDLAKEGYDPRAVSEPLYYLDTPSGEYRPLDSAIYKDIVDGKVNL